MRDLYELANDITAYLQGQGIYETCYPTYDDKLVVDVHRGDWKHEHLRLDVTVKKFFSDLCDDYKLETHYTETTETDGSDTYSADHYYVVSPVEEVSPFSVEDEIEQPVYHSRIELMGEAKNTKQRRNREVDAVNESLKQIKK